MQAFPKSLTLETQRCWLRFLELSRASDVLACVTDPRFPKNLPWASATTLEAVRERIRVLHSKWDEGHSYCFSIDDRHSGEYLGQITLSRDSEPRTWSLAFLISPSKWGQGFATECARRVLKFGFIELQARRIWAGAARENQPSLRVIEKLGMNHFRSNPEGYTIAGQPIPTEDFELYAPV